MLLGTTSDVGRFREGTPFRLRRDEMPARDDAG
jgi:hypothetical protein